MTKKTVVALIAAYLLVFTQSPFAEIYKWVDEQGRVHFTDKPPSTADSETVTLGNLNTYSTPTVVESVVDLGSPKKVVMYSAAWCGVCKRARNYFRQEGIPFSEYDIEKSSKGKRDFKKLGGKGVPVILVGKQRMNGFSAGKFETMYGG